MEYAQHDSRAAWLTAIGLLPFVVVGVALTASIYGAYFGIPLLALVGRPWWAATRSVQKHRRLGSTALGHTIVALAVFTAGFVVSVLLGLDDLDTPIEGLLLAIAVGWLTMCWFATAERVHAYLPIRGLLSGWPQRASVRSVHASTSATTVTVMAKQRIPTPEDRNTAIRMALSGIADDLELGKLAERLAPLHPKNDTFPGEVLLELAADAIEEAGATREQPLEVEGIRKRHLPEDRAHTKAQHHKAEYALRAAAMIRAGVDPGLLDEVIWWRTDDLWFWALEALVTYVRAAAERTDENVSVICGRIAGRHGVQLAAVT